MKRNGILLLLGGMLAWQPLGAQQTVTFAASEYAPLYNGQVEMPYTRSQYFNTPYYAGEEYVAGTLDLATGIQYTDIPTRIDLFRQQVVVLTPEEKRPVIVPHQKLAAVRLHGQEFRYHEPEGKPGEYSPLVLAYLGDAIYDLIIRTLVVGDGNRQVKKLHKATSALVQASAQSRMMEAIEGLLTEEEEGVYRRGRNAKSFSTAKNQSLKDYHRATGFEALLGWLYLKQDWERLLELVKAGLDHEKGQNE